MDNEKKEFGKWWLFVLALVVLTVIVISVLSYMGKITGTVVERQVFEQSYQKTASDNQRMSAYKAQLAAIESRLYTETDDAILSDLRAQKAMLEVQIKAGNF